MVQLSGQSKLNSPNQATKPFINMYMDGPGMVMQVYRRRHATCRCAAHEESEVKTSPDVSINPS